MVSGPQRELVVGGGRDLGDQGYVGVETNTYPVGLTVNEVNGRRC